MLIWGKTKTGLTCKSTPLAPLVTCFSFCRMHLSAEKICWVAQLVEWVNSHVKCWAHLAMSWMAGLWWVKCVRFSECLFEAKSLDIQWLDPKPLKSSTLESVPSLNHLIIISFFVCLYLYPHFLSVSISILIFCLSPSLSLSSVSLQLYLSFLSVSILILIFCLSPYRDGDR